MAYYPKITGNTNTALNLNTSSSSAINVVTLTNSETQKTEQYCVLTIRSTGDAGTNVNISKISTISSELEGSINSENLLNATGNLFTKQQNLEYQSRLFTISPLLRTDATTWTLEAPFIGTVKANYSVENVHTKNWATTGNGDYNIPAATTLEADGAASYVVIDSAGVMRPVTSYANYGEILTKGHTILPLYNHAYIVANNIPTGHYAAIVIRASAEQAFDVTKTHTLEIKHNANVEGQGSNVDYTIELTTASINIFETVAQYNSVAVANGDTTGTRKRSMNFIPTNSVTGNSWRFDVNSIGGRVAADRNTMPSYASGTTLTQAELNAASDDIYTSFQSTDQSIIAGYSETFPSTMKVFDNSFVKQAFSVSYLGDNSNFIPNTLFEDNAIEQGGNFIHEIKASDRYSQNGIGAVISDGAGGTISFGPDKLSGVYTNFLEADIIKEQNHTIIVKVGESIVDNIAFIENTIVYPLFSYHSDFANKNGTVVNISNAASITTPSEFVHVSDVVPKFTSLSNSITCVEHHPLYSWSFDAYTPGITAHNVTINTLSAEDVLDHNGLLPAVSRPDELSYVQTAEASTQIKTATSENSLALRTATNIATTVVPSVTDGKKHYTVIADIQNPSHSANTDISVLKDRTAAGFYSNQTVFGTKESTIGFKAPYASWQPGADAYGTERVPWFHLSNEYSLKTQYNEVRPLINLTYDTETAGVQMVPRLEFYGIPDLKTATTTNISDGIVDFGTQSFTETSRTVLITQGSDSLTHKTAGETDRQSYVQGMEVKGLDGYFPGRNFIGQVITHSSNATVIKLVQEGANGQAGTTPSVSTAASDAGITVEICKPTQKVNFTRNTYSYDSTLPNLEERFRIHKTYGSDLSYTIPLVSASQLKVQDSVIAVNTIVASESAAFNALFDEADVPINSLAVVTTNPTSVIAQNCTVVNMSPKEKGITYNGAEISSERYYNNDKNTDCYLGDQVGMYYHTILLPVSGVYTHSMKFHLTNLGEEDVIFNYAKLVDPVYLPENSYMLKPHGSNAPTWTLGHSITTASTLKDNATNPISTTTAYNIHRNASPSDMSLIGVGSVIDTVMIRPLQKFQGAYTDSLPVSSFNKNGNDNNELIVNFSQATNSSVAGDYYKCLEVVYVRDVGALQRYYKSDDDTVFQRDYKDQGFWVMRKLIKITVTTTNKIKITDVDSDEVSPNDNVIFQLTV
tara:strand:- start:1596 stop:5207 length:3612 start_codon:yes stop_codon:yes gene_type:complete